MTAFGDRGDGPPVSFAGVTGSADDTRTLGAALASVCEPGDVILLAGDLGAGKTTLAQGFGRALEVDEPVTSPTFALLRHYACGPGALDRGIRTFLHVDVYRLDQLAEVVDLGIGELVEDGGVALVEWGDVASPVLGAGALNVHLVVEPGDGTPPGSDAGRRRFTVDGAGIRWASRHGELTSILQPWVTVR